MNFALYDGVDRYGGIAENDPALETLRASHEVVDLNTVDRFVYINRIERWSLA